MNIHTYAYIYVHKHSHKHIYGCVKTYMHTNIHMYVTRQHTLPHCNTQQHNVTHCNTLQHTVCCVAVCISDETPSIHAACAWPPVRRVWRKERILRMQNSFHLYRTHSILAPFLCLYTCVYAYVCILIHIYLHLYL